MMWAFFVCFFEREASERVEMLLCCFFFLERGGRCWCSFLQASSFLPILLFPPALKEEIADLAKRMGEERRKTVERML